MTNASGRASPPTPAKGTVPEVRLAQASVPAQDIGRGQTVQGVSVVNLFENPSLELNANGWVAFGGQALTLIGTDAYYGSYCARVEGAAGLGGVRLFQLDNVTRIVALPSIVYNFRLWYKGDTGSTTPVTSMRFYDASGVLIGSTTNSLPFLITGATPWTEILLAATSPSNAAFVTPAIEETISTWAAGEFVKLDGAMLWTGSVDPGYVDGAQFGCGWLGTAHQSKSIHLGHKQNAVVTGRMSGPL